MVKTQVQCKESGFSARWWAGFRLRAGRGAVRAWLLWHGMFGAVKLAGGRWSQPGPLVSWDSGSGLNMLCGAGHLLDSESASQLWVDAEADSEPPTGLPEMMLRLLCKP